MPISAYVANVNSNNVSVVDTVGFTVLATIAVGNGPAGVAVTPDLTKAYVSNSTDGTVSVIVTATNTVSTTITVGSGPGGIAVTPDGKKVLVVNSTAGTVSVISTSTNLVLGTITLPLHGGSASSAWQICISPNSLTAYVVAEVTGGTGGTYVEVLNIAALSSTTSILSTNSSSGGILNTIQGICVSPDGLHLYVTGRLSGTQNVISTVSNTIVGTMADSTGEPDSITILPNGTKGFWTNSFGDLYVFNPTTFAVITHVTLINGDFLTGIAPTSDSTLVFVADAGPSPARASALLWKVNSTTPTTHSSLNLTQNHSNGIGLSYYPVPPPPTPGYPGATFIPKLFIPIKGKVTVDYTAAELMANWIAIEIWSQRWNPLPPVALFIPRKNSTRSSDLDANWIIMENWVNQINQAEKAPYPDLFIPRKNSNQPFDLDVDFLRIQNWANGIARG